MFKELIQQKNNLHHSYLLEGNPEKIYSKLTSFLEKEINFSTQNNPDFWNGNFDTFGIDDGRKINNLQNKKTFAKGKKIFVITSNFITIEAQNSLLKMFEEPTKNTHFFLIMSSGEILLPTLKSRLMNLKSKNTYNSNSSNIEIENFLKNSVKEKLKFIQKFTGDKKKKIPTNKIGAINFLNQIEETLFKKNYFKTISKKEIFIFKEISKSKDYLSDRSPSVKNILEHITLII